MDRSTAAAYRAALAFLREENPGRLPKSLSIEATTTGAALFSYGWWALMVRDASGVYLRAEDYRTRTTRAHRRGVVLALESEGYCVTERCLAGFLVVVPKRPRFGSPPQRQALPRRLKKEQPALL